ncbi:hypothetical protein GCM10009812_09450 [Nocardioides marinus]|uniref:Endonuclease n=1 Tax=Nocardioides marinus TaxID=374514 RepID=A0A7Y9YAE1_9ACTN|nr:hypothetical protein [Nocardioides marinus]NYI08541.1 hypothetical protein [Nocardioides marinus]
MTEAEVQAAFVGALYERGWDVTTENADYTDVIARRGTDVLIAEVKGETRSVGTDVDTAYGQLLRRMADRGVASVRYALVVPAAAAPAALRVPEGVRETLAIDIWQVAPTGAVSTDSPWFASLGQGASREGR